MRRALVLAYGIVGYLLFFGTFAYAVGFLANFGVPKSIDSGPQGPLSTALLVNLGLLGVFALQHSVMARPGFKRWWTRIVPEPIERATYVLLSSAALWLLFWQWRPIAGAVWHLDSQLARAVLTGIYLGGFGLIFYSSLLISHFDLFGLRQVMFYARGVRYDNLPFATPSLYKVVRHPLYVGWFLTFWAAPTMTWGHLFFAAVATGYILVALVFEERDLVEHFGADYARYREEVPALLPRSRPGRIAPPPEERLA